MIFIKIFLIIQGKYMEIKNIRNFSIIAHIDHGKTTLSDRILELTGALSDREMKNQVLDSMSLERERGITIKAHFVRLKYHSEDGGEYILNLIDTPGHVDFSYEVSRSLSACEGAILLVDATQGIEAQTLANTYLAFENNLEIIPVINKIDLPGADVERVVKQVESVIGIKKEEIFLVSAKTGKGVKELLEAVIKKIPPPSGSMEGPLKALIFDSWYDTYRGVITLLRVFDGEIKRGMKIKFMATGREYEVEELGVITPKFLKVDSLKVGEVGYLIGGIKELKDVKIGDTITSTNNPAVKPLPGFKEMKPVVFSGFYPVLSEQYDDLKDALMKLQLNDSSFFFEPETSDALGFGFRCGFLGMLHMEIIQSRLEREFGIDLISTAPNVKYKVVKKDGSEIFIESPSKLPPATEIDHIEEPFYTTIIMTEDEYLGGILSLLESRRGIQVSFEYIGPTRVVLTYEMPLNEILVDFHDKLKSVSRGYASFDYTFSGYKKGDLVKMDILVNGNPVDALSVIVHKDFAYRRGQEIVRKLKELIPRQLYEVAIQAAIGSRVIARATVKPLRKNVLAKCYGGDVTRKRKLLEKQKEGKKRMKKIGKVSIPQEAFLAVLKIKD